MKVGTRGLALGLTCVGLGAGLPLLAISTTPGPSTHAARTTATATAASTEIASAASASPAALPPVRHVFVIVEENEAESTTFGSGSPAPYLSQTLPARGAYLSQYYGIGHNSLDNYIAMVSGQAPNPDTSGDCQQFVDFPSGSGLASNGQQTGEGCVYPAAVPTLMSQLNGAGLTWRAYEDGMGADPARDNPGNQGDVDCGHPIVGTADQTEGETASDQYATKHDPFVYFHSVIDDQAECDADVVPLSRLSADLQSAATTPNYVFITPSLCDDGHDASCDNGGAGGLAQIDTFLRTWVPQITGSPAFQQNGLLIVTFDETAGGDDTACCGEYPGPFDSLNGIEPGGGGPGGGVVGAVLLSPFIAPGTVSSVPYNHFSMLGTVEDLFGLGRLGEAVGLTAFGTDVFTRAWPVDSGLTVAPGSIAVAAGSSGKHELTISYRDSRAATTQFALARLVPGYLTGTGTARCTALRSGRQRPDGAKACSAALAVGSFTHADHVGANTVRFNGHVGGRALAAGSYELVATPALGSVLGAQLTARFRIVPSGR
jgi:hypothetical protein